jgi:protein kinase A
MPTLGFLKKKRTKESGSKELSSTTTDSTSQPGSPITPTTSAGFETLSTSTTGNSAGVRAVSLSSNGAIRQNQPVAGEQSSMTQGATQYQQSSSSHNTAEKQQNLPSISNLINPPQHDGAGQSLQTAQMASTNNGAIVTNGPAMEAVQQSQQPVQARTTKGKYTLGDFEIQRTLGTGSFGRVHLVQSKHNQRYYAVKVLKKQQVVKMKQVEHTNDERKMLQEVKHPFLITLWGTFQDSKNLYMVMDFVEGGELFSLLRKSQVCRISPPAH